MADANITPAFLRSRARHYREMAEKGCDPKLAIVYRELAKAFDKEAEAKESGEC
jgi:hypothetical protein